MQAAFLLVTLLGLFAANVCADTNFRAGPYGGNGGKSFDHSEALLGEWGAIRALEVNHGDIVDRIAVTYEDGTTFAHGGGGGDRSRIELENDESIVRVDLRYGDLLDQIKFTTSAGNEFGPYGGNGG